MTGTFFYNVFCGLNMPIVTQFGILLRIIYGQLLLLHWMYLVGSTSSEERESWQFNGSTTPSLFFCFLRSMSATELAVTLQECLDWSTLSPSVKKDFSGCKVVGLKVWRLFWSGELLSSFIEIINEIDYLLKKEFRFFLIFASISPKVRKKVGLLLWHGHAWNTLLLVYLFAE